MTKAKRKPHLLSVSDQLLKRLAERGELSAQTAGEFARQLLSCFLDGLPLPPRVPTLLEQPAAPPPPRPQPAPIARALEPEPVPVPAPAPVPQPQAPPAPVADYRMPTAVPPVRAAAPPPVRQYPPPVVPAAEPPPRPLFQPAPAPPPVVATGPNPDIDFNNPDDEALRRATELLDSSARRQS